MQQTVRLLGDLGKRYGSEHEFFDLRSPAEAIKLLCINQPELLKELAEAHDHGIGYTVVQADQFLGYEELQLPLGKNDLVVTPVVAGSGGDSTTKILIGVAIVGLSFGIGAIASAGVTLGGLAGIGTVATATAAFGASLVLGGISEMIAPQPVVDPISSTGGRTAPGQNTNATGPQGVSRATSGQQSYAFSGPANTVGVGATVPLVYGKMLVGSHLISSKVQITSDSEPTGEFFVEPGPNSITINGEKPTNLFASHNGLRTRLWKNHHIKLGDVEESGEFVRKKSADIIKFTSREDEKNDDMRHYTGTRRENLQIFLEIDKGLSRIVGNQTVPAFLTYEITVKKDKYPGESPVFTNVRGTIQGLLRKTDSYKFCHAVTYGLSGVEDDETEVVVRVRVLDTDADNKDGRLVIRSLGYKHFRDDDENETEDLVSEA